MNAAHISNVSNPKSRQVYSNKVHLQEYNNKNTIGYCRGTTVIYIQTLSNSSVSSSWFWLCKWSFFTVVHVAVGRVAALGTRWEQENTGGGASHWPEKEISYAWSIEDQQILFHGIGRVWTIPRLVLVSLRLLQTQNLLCSPWVSVCTFDAGQTTKSGNLNFPLFSTTLSPKALALRRDISCSRAWTTKPIYEKRYTGSIIRPFCLKTQLLFW